MSPRFVRRCGLLRRGLIASVSVVIAFGLGLAPPVAAAEIFWDGNAFSGFPPLPNPAMSLGNNWTGGTVPLTTDSIAFDSRSFQTNPFNNFSTFQTRGIRFAPGALAHTITGGTIRINGIGTSPATITNSSNSTQSLNNSLITLFGQVAGNTHIFSQTNSFGSLNIGANVNMNRQNLTFSAFSGSTSTIGGIISSSNALAGEGGLTKSGFGTLILGANNTYTGGTAINGGTLQIGSFSSLGQTGVGFSFNGGTLRTTGNNLGTNRAVTLSANGGTFNVDSFRTLELNAAIGGVGLLKKDGRRHAYPRQQQHLRAALPTFSVAR